jgi:hypothetical protein
MGSKSNCVLNAVVMAVVLNLLLPAILKPFAAPEEIKPPSGAAALSLKGQFMHMMVHHNQVPLMSSFIVALITGLAVFLGYTLCPVTRLRKLV